MRCWQPKAGQQTVYPRITSISQQEGSLSGFSLPVKFANNPRSRDGRKLALPTACLAKLRDSQSTRRSVGTQNRVRAGQYHQIGQRLLQSPQFLHREIIPLRFPGLLVPAVSAPRRVLDSIMVITNAHYGPVYSGFSFRRAGFYRVGLEVAVHGGRVAAGAVASCPAEPLPTISTSEQPRPAPVGETQLQT